jgi:hypothetical protein
MNYREPKLIGLACVALLAIVWFGAKHYATAKAQDAIQGYLIRNNLTSYVTYSDISASPFGTATIYDVKLDCAAYDSVSIGSLKISDVHFKNDQLVSLAIAARFVSLPIISWARRIAFDNPARQAVGLGYTSLTGNLSFRIAYHPGNDEFTASTTADWTDAGSWRINLKLDNFDRSLLYNLSHPTLGFVTNTFNDPSELLSSLARISLADANVTIDNSGLRTRESEVIDAEIPGAARSDSLLTNANVEFAGMRDDLVKAGMTPSAAEQMSTTLASWYADGGKIKLSTQLTQPLPLVTSGPVGAMDTTPRFAFDSVAGFLAATNAEVSR